MFYEDENEKDILETSGDIQISEDGVVSWGDVLNSEPEEEITVIENVDEDDNSSINADEIELVPSKDEVESTDEDELKKLLEEGDSSLENDSADESEDIEVDFSDDNIETSDSSDDFQDDISPRNAPKKSSSISPILLALLAAILVSVVGYFVYTFLQDNNGGTSNQDLVPNSQQMREVTQEDIQSNKEEIQEDIQVINESNENMLQPTQEEAKKEEKKEVVDIKPEGRSNPFLPNSKYISTIVPETYINFENSTIPQPPKVYPKADQKTTKLQEIAVSGIMYDNVKPSAIITYEGNDYFVQKGDMLDDYKVIEISRSYVLIAYGSNTYKANIGEEFRITSKFDGNAQYIKTGRQYQALQRGGGYPKADEGMVEINAD